jgi:hypothetical protein
MTLEETTTIYECQHCAAPTMETHEAAMAHATSERHAVKAITVNRYAHRGGITKPLATLLRDRHTVLGVLFHGDHWTVLTTRNR